MAGRRVRTWLILGGLAVAAAVQPAACRRPQGGSDLDPEVVRALLADVHPQVVAPAVADVLADARALSDAASAWAAAEAAGTGGVQAREVAREAWIALMEDWERVEVLQIGPAAPSLDAVGGMDLRDEIYAWPTTNRCRVDQETVARGFDAPDFFDTALVNVVGLDALETLLFSPDDDNGCPPLVPPNDDGSFDALGPDGVRAYRADYAAVLAARVVDRVEALDAAWRDGFARDLERAGEPGSPFASQQEALDAVFAALFYVELATKDDKLGAPLGLRSCGQADCTYLVETPLAGLSDRWIRANLDGFRALFTGGEGVGFDDLLASAGHDRLVTDVLAALDASAAAADALQVPVDVAAATAAAPALAVHAALTDLTTLLDGDFAAALRLQVPTDAAGDND